MKRIDIPQVGRTIDVGPGETILAKALEAGIAYPHGCRSGRCGACKSRLLEGEVELLPHTPFALSPSERAQGLVLACRAVPQTDATIAWLGHGDELAEFPVRRLAGRIAAVGEATHDIKLIRIALDDRSAFRFRPGQYARLTFPDLPPRDYSMASRPEDDLLEFHVRCVPGGATSARIFHRAMPGDPVTVEGPLGSAFLREKHAGPILAVAGGSGLAPIKAIVETAVTRSMRQPIHVYFGARTERDLYLTGHFRSLEAAHPDLRFVPVLSTEAPPGHRSGTISDAVAADLSDLDGWKAYVAGPPAMVEATGAALLARGMRSADIHADAFFTPDHQAS
ncbi:2Fe-2S iron-sulfur cluster-binding protein [Inquilinus sp. Marseille-Q2685]|uniref:2Fe-2S iron-sulfur cluster-binding protein n=1 Tax=Inquilinus sp. Marseille-Q2685 TaxID=2866581 RepID=UPI001CE49106|nr:2Fe-2S iron-sulfur cluster-binding protein [Inquilinus sp. Marseille-Q2685]